MAGYPPSEQAIESLISLTGGVTRDEAVARLKGNENNVEKAVNEFWDDPNSFEKYRWNESHFSSERDGEVQQAPPSFLIHHADEPGPYEVRDPQTRPSSRTTNNRSPLGKVIDMTFEHSVADPSTSMTLNHDDDLQRAIEESRITAGMPPQESGITGTDEVHFGPANRGQYEPGKWDLVPTGKTSAQEILLDPDPAERKRDLNVPAFLKPSVEKHRLGALFTIYHEIPLLREVFLNRLEVQQNYGYDNEWWTGRAIEGPTIVGSELDETQEVIQEIQRLMAFLDKTDRSYGSADALANLRAVTKLLRRNNRVALEAVVLNAWKAGVETRETGLSSKLFSVGVDREDHEEAMPFAILDLALPEKDSGVETLYDLADDALWSDTDADTDIASCAYLEHIADVIAFRLQEPSEPCKNIEVPSVWYADRYLKSERLAARDMRLQKREIKYAMDRISVLQKDLTSFSTRNGKDVKVQNLFKAALQHDVDEIDYSSLEQNGDVAEDVPIPPRPSAKSAKLSEQLRKIVASIDTKLQTLSDEREKARDAMRQLSKLYTEASTDATQPPTHRYTLRGVSTTNSIVYICRQADIDLMDMGLDNSESSLNGDQWWRIKYSPSGPNLVTVEKTTEEKVLEAAKTESKDILLVYASDKAMQFEPKPLPNALETFVRNDNVLFKAELHDEETQSQVTSPGKRKFDAQSEDSQEESSRWNGGTSPKGYEGYESSVQVMERELRTAGESPDLEAARAASQNLENYLDDRSTTVTPNGIDSNELIVGVDPSIPTNDGTPFSGQEMQERNGILPMLSGRPKTSGVQTSTIDSMDLDQVVEEDENITEASPAVRNIGL